MTSALRLIAALVVLATTTPAMAERINTYWRLVPVERSSTEQVGRVFSEQRLLPLRLVRLDDPVAIGRRTLARGTLLYLVFNDAGRIGYCTVRERSGPSLLPIADTRPCLTDQDNDGRLDASFSVFDKYGGPPTVRGSIDDARPFGGNAGFSQADINDFPVDMRMQFTFRGSRDRVDRVRIQMTFTGPIAGSWPDTYGVQTHEGFRFVIGNATILLKTLTTGAATFEVAFEDSVITSNNRNTLFWAPLPAFLAGLS